MRSRSLFLVLLFVAGLLSAQDVKPAMKTRWSRDEKLNVGHTGYPRPQLVRDEWKNLNGAWDYAISSNEQKSIPIAYQGKIKVPFPVESVLSGVQKALNPDQYLWYRTTFRIPEGWKNKRILLHFGAVDWEATVYVNQEEVIIHRGGYDSFGADITPNLKNGEKQELIVRVWDPTDTGEQPIGKQRLKPGGIWYTACSGIWQTVWIEPVPDIFIRDLIMVPDIDKNLLKVRVHTNPGEKPQNLKAIVSSGDKMISMVSAISDSVFIIPLNDPVWWSPDNPFLYDLRIILTNQAGRADSVQSYFGMRKIEIKTVNGFKRIFLNNSEIFQTGPLDQGYWPDGIYTAPSDDALKYDLEMTKEFGFNMSRKHTKVEPERWYYWADKLGLLVWQDIPSMIDNKEPGKEGQQQFKAELTRIVQQHINHPSVIMWVVFNEGWGQHNTVELTEYTMALDTSRLVSCASGWIDFPAGHIKDVHSYPAPSYPEPDTTRASVLGEYWGVALAVKGHLWDTASWGYIQVKDTREFEIYYDLLMQQVENYRDEKGLNAAVVTQITDVEKEINGLMTYDRDVVKPERERIRKSNMGEHLKTDRIVPASENEKFNWIYSFSLQPADSSGWFLPGFNSDDWQKGQGGFGEEGTPGTSGIIGTKWTEGSIYIRREFFLPQLSIEKVRNLKLWLFHDDKAEVYINGIRAGEYSGWTTSYTLASISEECLDALKPGEMNIIAIKCTDDGYGNFIDAGLILFGDQQ